MEYLYDAFTSIIWFLHDAGEAIIFTLSASIITLAIGISIASIPISVATNWGSNYASDNTISYTLLLGFLAGFLWVIWLGHNTTTIGAIWLCSIGLCLALVAVSLLIYLLSRLNK